MNYRLVYNTLGKKNQGNKKLKGSVCAAEVLHPNHIKNGCAESTYPFYLVMF